MEVVIDEHENVVNVIKNNTIGQKIDLIINWINEFINNFYLYINDLFLIGKEYYKYCQADELYKTD